MTYFFSPKVIPFEPSVIDREIRSISAEIVFYVTGNWRQPLTRNVQRPVMTRKESPYVTINSSQVSFPDINLFLDVYDRENIDAEVAEITFRANSLNHGWPIGQLVEVLTNYVTMQLALPLITKSETSNGEVKITEARIVVFVNSKLAFKISQFPKVKVILPDSGYRVINVAFEKPIFKF